MADEKSDKPSAETGGEELTEVISSGPSLGQPRSSRSAALTIFLVIAILASLALGAFAGIIASPYVYANLNLLRELGVPIPSLTAEGPGQVTPGAGQRITISPGEERVVPVAAKLKPSVVNVRTEAISTREFPFAQQRQEGTGSGVIFREDGYILTNEHVVRGADSIFVTIGTDLNVEAELVGADQVTDVAVIKVDRDNLRAADLGTSKDLQVGQLVVAFGSPFGFEQTVTSGVISALSRDLPVEGTLQGRGRTLTGLIQTDAAINPGNSGGPLANAKGEVIGINNLIFSTLGGGSAAFQGIGFAIPIDTAKRIADELITTGKASHPYLGIFGDSVTQSLAEQLDLPVETGAVIVGTVPDGPASKGGLQQGDIIVKVGDEDITNFDELVTIINEASVGDELAIEYLREGKRAETGVTLTERPQDF